MVLRRQLKRIQANVVNWMKKLQDNIKLCEYINLKVNMYIYCVTFLTCAGLGCLFF